MANKYDKYLNEPLVVWNPVQGTSDPYREFEYYNAVEIKGRWFTGRHEVVDAEGNHVTAEHSALVDRQITIGAYLYRGAGNEVNPSADPRSVPGAHRVISFYSVDDRKMKNKLRSVSMA